MYCFSIFARCFCPPEWTSLYCEIPYIPCSPSPCRNGGSCVVMGPLNYECRCVAGKTINLHDQYKFQNKLVTYFYSVDLLFLRFSSQLIMLNISMGMYWGRSIKSIKRVLKKKKIFNKYFLFFV